MTEYSFDSSIKQLSKIFNFLIFFREAIIFCILVSSDIWFFRKSSSSKFKWATSQHSFNLFSLQISFFKFNNDEIPLRLSIIKKTYYLLHQKIIRQIQVHQRPDLPDAPEIVQKVQSQIQKFQRNQISDIEILIGIEKSQIFVLNL